MAQRILIAACLSLTAAGLALTGLVWQQSNKAANAAAAANHRLAELFAQTHTDNQAKIAELLAKTQATNEEILKQLQAIAGTAESPRSPDWIPVSFKLTQETLDGPPAVGYEVTLVKGSAGLFERGIRRESDSSGLVDFGVVHPGDWTFVVWKPRDERHTWTCEGSINVLPATNLAKTIICPRIPPVFAEVTLRVQWPAELAGVNLRLEATFFKAPTTFQPPLKFTVVDAIGEPLRQRILCGPGTKQTEIGGVTILDFLLFREFPSGESTLGGVPLYGAPAAILGNRAFADFRFESIQAGPTAIAMETGSYLAHRLVVLRPLVRQNPKMKGERFEVLAHTVATRNLTGDVAAYYGDPVEGGRSLDTTLPLEKLKGDVTVGSTYWRELDGRFAVRPGQVNHWTLPLPEELIAAARKEIEVGK